MARLHKATGAIKIKKDAFSLRLWRLAAVSEHRLEAHRGAESLAEGILSRYGLRLDAGDR